MCILLSNLKRKFKKQVLIYTRKVDNFKIEIKKKYLWYGNSYGGFYICPDLLNEKSVIYSFGIGEDISWDLKINNQFNCNIYMFDPTPKSINWVKKQNLNKAFHFYDYGIASETSLVDFYLPTNPDHVSGSILKHKYVDNRMKVSVSMKSLADICKELHHIHIDILKMDIEGAEYETIASILDSGIQIDQILIEFHSRFFEDGVNKTNNAIDYFRNKGYKIFAVSDSFEEVSFIKN